LNSLFTNNRIIKDKTAEQVKKIGEIGPRQWGLQGQQAAASRISYCVLREAIYVNISPNIEIRNSSFVVILRRTDKFEIQIPNVQNAIKFEAYDLDFA